MIKRDIEINLIKIFFYIISCFLINLSHAQTLTGTVQDTLKLPLPNANVIAKPKQPQGKIKFAIADHLGLFSGFR